MNKQDNDLLQNQQITGQQQDIANMSNAELLFSRLENLLMKAPPAMFSGPFAPPQLLEQYKAVDENFPERIFNFAETNAQHIREKENEIINITHTQNMAIIDKERYKIDKETEQKKE